MLTENHNPVECRPLSSTFYCVCPIETFPIHTCFWGHVFFLRRPLGKKKCIHSYPHVLPNYSLASRRCFPKQYLLNKQEEKNLHFSRPLKWPHPWVTVNKACHLQPIHLPPERRWECGVPSMRGTCLVTSSISFLCYKGWRPQTTESGSRFLKVPIIQQPSDAGYVHVPVTHPRTENEERSL